MPTVLITGAGSGLGAALADLYRDKGWQVVALDRARADLADPAAVAALARDPVVAASGAEVAVFAAGTSEIGAVRDLDAAAFRRCLEVNFLAPLELFRTLCRAEPPCRSFVFVLSGAADVLVPGLGPYALSKRALRDFLRIVELEGLPAGARALVVRPGPLDTGFDRKTRVHGGGRVPGPLGRPRDPREVALRIYQAERAGLSRLTLSRAARVLGWLQDLAPGLAALLLRRRR